MKDHVINIFYSEENEGYIADIPDLKYCSAVGDTELEALQELLLARAAWFEVAETEAKSISPISLSSSKVRTNTRTVKSLNKTSNIPALRPNYQGQTLLEAIAQVLKSNVEHKVNADMVVKELHGELSPDLHKIARQRVNKSLSKGKNEGKWDRVPEQPGVYTFSLTKIKS